MFQKPTAILMSLRDLVLSNALFGCCAYVPLPSDIAPAQVTVLLLHLMGSESARPQYDVMHGLVQPTRAMRTSNENEEHQEGESKCPEIESIPLSIIFQRATGARIPPNSCPRAPKSTILASPSSARSVFMPFSVTSGKPIVEEELLSHPSVQAFHLLEALITIPDHPAPSGAW